MKNIRNFWNNLSIAHKLNFVIGVMAFLIVAELFTLRFAMSKLSAARSLVGGESLWSKAQKDAVFSLQRYEQTRNEKDYQEFLNYLKIPEGDHQARIGLTAEPFNYQVVKEGFTQGQIHEEDIAPIIDLLRKFYWISYLKKAIEIWTNGDVLLGQLKEEGIKYHEAVLGHRDAEAKERLGSIKKLNQQLTKLEADFSETLGAGSRWLENVILLLLTIAVLMVETVGISLAFVTNRSISRRLAELQWLASEMAQGRFNRSISVSSQDEIGQLTLSVNQMGAALESSYHELERRVEERTTEARAAVQMRDEFLSIASHELRTPLTALTLELQLLARKVEKLGVSEEKSQTLALSDKSLNAVKRLTLLLDELLDLTRIQVGKFEVHPKEADLVPILHDCVSKFSLEASQLGSTITIDSPPRLVHVFDPLRIEQVLTNLISNALKYGGSGNIDVAASMSGSTLKFFVRDYGPGIPLEKQATLFERFERADANQDIQGLGLGLYISKQIIDAHGGMLAVESEPGKGAKFVVTLKKI